MVESTFKHNVSGYDYITENPKRLGEHLGEWIAVVGNGIVASGDDISGVYEKSKTNYPEEIPLIMKIPKETTMLL